MRTFLAVAVLIACTLLGAGIGERFGYDFGYATAEQASWDKDSSFDKPAQVGDACRVHTDLPQCL